MPTGSVGLWYPGDDVVCIRQCLQEARELAGFLSFSEGSPPSPGRVAGPALREIVRLVVGVGQSRQESALA